MKERKQCLPFYISVEGEVCEYYYFKHLQNLINNSNINKYNVNFKIKKKKPSSFAKSKTILYDGEDTQTFYHIQDLENYKTHNEKFQLIIDDINNAKRMFKVNYKLGYSNFTFELWMILHKIDLLFDVGHRNKYVKYINKAFNKRYEYLDEYKAEDEFLKILDKIDLTDVLDAISRSKKIREQHQKDGHAIINYKKFEYYKENPDLTVDLCVEEIFIKCGVLTKT